MTVQTVPRPQRSSGQRQTSSVSLADVVSAGRGLPSRVILHGVEGIGKTSFAAQSPSPIFLMARGETGLETLIDAGLLSETPSFPESKTWGDTLAAIDVLTRNDHPYRTLVLDTLNGFERLCHEHVCLTNYGGDWGERGFTGYMRGYETSLADWRELLISLDRLREERKMGIICLCHTKVAPFKNPEGPDYDRYQPDMHPKTWSLTHKWADVVMFGNFETFIDKESPKGRAKGKGGQDRFLYTERSAAFDAKNRHGLPGQIAMKPDAAGAWAEFSKCMRAHRTNGTKE